MLQHTLDGNLPLLIQQGGLVLALAAAVVVLWRALNDAQKQLLEIAVKIEPLLVSVQKLLEKLQ